MTIIQGNSKNELYDFRESLKFLLQSVDVGVTALLARRAVELHAFQFSLYYPYFTQLPPFKERPLPKKDVVALARKYAALQLFNYYASRALYKNTFGMKRTPSLNNIETGLADNFKPIEALLELLKDYLTAESDGRGVIEKGISRKGFVKEFRHQVEKSIAIARLIDAYMTNGDELPSTHGRPIGSKIMREALRKAASAKLSRSKVESVRVSQRDLTAWGLLSKLSQKTLFNYFDELEPTAVFLYLKEIHHCKPVLNPLDHYDKDFPQEIMQTARSVDDLRGVCLMYNAAVTELNEKYRFTFALIENVPKPETETEYDALVDCERDPDLTEAIKAVTGQTA
jgi:hypothetical protein